MNRLRILIRRSCILSACIAGGLLSMAPIWGFFTGLDSLIKRSEAIVIAEIPPLPPPDYTNYDPTNGTVDDFRDREVIIRRSLRGSFAEGQRLRVGSAINTWLSPETEGMYSAATRSTSQNPEAAEHRVIISRYKETAARHPDRRESGFFLMFLSRNPNLQDPFEWWCVNDDGSMLEVPPSTLTAPLKGGTLREQILDLVQSYPLPPKPESESRPSASTLTVSQPKRR